MAWLQNLAGKAEDLLNKVDKNAGRVLNESIVITPKSLSTKSSSVTDLNGLNVIEPPHHIISVPNNNPEESVNSTVKIDLSVEQQEEVINEEVPQELQDSIEADTSYSPFERVKSMTDSIGIMSVSSSNSLNIDGADPGLTAKLEAQLAKCEGENEQLSKEILNLQHMHSGLLHENSNLQSQLDRANEAVLLAQNEMQEYRARARRMLEDREKALLPQQEQTSLDINSEIVKINQELKNDLDKEYTKNQNLEARFNAVSKELAGLQQQYLTAQKENQRIQESLRYGITNEKKTREDIEEEHRQTSKELQKVQKLLNTAQRQELSFKTEISNLESQLKLRLQPTTNSQDTQLQSLTQMLMHKQSALDTLTSERNALRIQLEKSQQEYKQLSAQRISGGASRPANHSVIHDYDDSRIPRLMQVSPLDAGVTQRVKHAYSTLDTFSIRTGVFLRRYPLARIFLICYMMLLHLWVLLILFTYVPGTR